MWNKKKKKDIYWIKTKNPITNPWADAVTISAFNASAVTSTVMGPNPKIIPDSRVLSVFISPGFRVVPQLPHPLHSWYTLILLNIPPVTEIEEVIFSAVTEPMFSISIDTCKSPPLMEEI